MKNNKSNKKIQFIFHHKVIAIIVSLVTIGLIIGSAIIFLHRENKNENTTKQPNLNT